MEESGIFESKALEFLGGDGYLDDEPLDDLHLNNAINLDFVKNLLGEEIEYKLHVPSYVLNDYRDLMSERFFRDKQHRKPGFQQVTPLFTGYSPQMNLTNFDVAGKIFQTIKTASKKYKLNLPLEKLDNNILESIRIPKLWWHNFEALLGAIGGRAEMKRGGEYIKDVPNIKYSGGVINCELWSLNNKRYILSCNSHISAITEKNKEVENEVYVGNSDSMLLLMDTLGQRICLLLSNQICSLSDTPGVLKEEYIEEILNAGDDCIKELGNKAYEVIALFEAFNVATLLKKNRDPVNDPDLFFSNCQEELVQLFTDKNERKIAISTVQRWINVLACSENEQISNIFCLYRIWGHPIVDIKAGMQKVYELGTKEKHVQKKISNTIVLQFRKMFLTSFYKKHKTYPPHSYSNDDPLNYVIRCLKANHPIKDRDTRYSLLQFENIILDKIWEMPETYDIFHILQDKAVSPTRSELLNSLKSGRGTQCGELRRGLWRWLKGDSIRCKEFLESIDKNGLSDDSKIIGLYEKEREIKIAARMFALMSEEMRYYFVLTEEMIANYILPYFPEITMKDTLNTLLRKFWTHAKREDLDQLDVNINIDFSKWNLNMRDDLVKGVFQEIDKLFGYSNLVSQTHEIFEQSYIYSASGKYIPPHKQNFLLSDPPMAYTGHLGGFEGLRQKGWTIVTVLILTYIADLYETKISLMGQGDNQVVKIHMPRNKWISYKFSMNQQAEDAKIICNKYVEAMDQNFKAAQLPIKVRETWRSCKLFMYGKMMTLNNSTLPQWYKKVLRSYALSNEGVLTFGGVIGTIATNMSAAASTSIHPDILYIVYLLLAEWSGSILLRYHPFTRRSYINSPPDSVHLASGKKREVNLIKNVNWNNFLATILTIPTSIGGNVTIPLTSFICRGFPDPVSEGYAWVKFLIHGEGDFTKIFQTWYSFIANPSIEPDHLIQSPLMINHKKPPTPEIQSREIVREWLLNGQFDNNRFIHNAERILRPFDRKDICLELLTDPFSPLIAHELYQVLPQVALDSVLRRVENTRTIRKMALSMNSKTPVLSKLMEVETNFLAYICWRMTQRGEVFSMCATRQAREARDQGWGRTIIHITTPHPLELLQEQRCFQDNIACNGRDYILAKLKSKEGFTPYLGSKTKVKVFTSQDESARKEPLLAISARLARYTSWLGLGENTKRFIEKATRITCNLDVYDNFFAEDLSLETFTGSVEHRFQPTGVSDGSFINYAPQVGKRVFLSSDFLPEYGRGQNNYTLAFQPLYCFLQYIASQEYNTPLIHFHLDCKDCIVPVIDSVPDMRSSTPAINKALKPELHEVIRETLGSINTRTELTTLKNPELFGMRRDISSTSPEVIKRSILRCLGHKIALDIRTYQETKSVNLGLEDLQNYPRIYAYKIYAEEILTEVSEAIIFQSLLKNSMGLNITKINACKRAIIRHLSSIPAEGLKSLGSILIGRKSKDSCHSFISITRQFPESVSSFLETVRISLMDSIECVLDVTKNSREVIVLPVSFINKRIHLYILSQRATDSRCPHHLYADEFEQSITSEKYPDCKNRCIRKSLRYCYLTNATIDKFFKCLNVVKGSPYVNNTQVLPTGYIAPLKTSVSSTGRVSQEIIERYQHLTKYNRVLCIPTASIYKWENFKIPNSRKKAIILGDGTGGTSLSIATNHPNISVYPCALLEGNRGIPQDILSIVPGLSRFLPNVSYQAHLDLPDDILHRNWTERFQSLCLSLDPKDLIIFSDVEHIQGNKLLTQKIIDNAPEGTYLVLKVYLHEYKNGGFGYGLEKMEIKFSNWVNLEYGEIIISGYKNSQILGAKEEMIEKLVELFAQRIFNRYEEQQYNDQIISKYNSLWKYNVHFVFQQVSYCGVPLNKDVSLLIMHELVGYLNSYLKNNYYFGSNKIKENTKKVTPYLKDSLQKAAIIIISSAIKNTSGREKLAFLQIQPKSTDRSPTLVFTKFPNDKLFSECMKYGNILRKFREQKNVQSLVVQDLEYVLSEQIDYASNHRTYAWTLGRSKLSSSTGSTLMDDIDDFI